MAPTPCADPFSCRTAAPSTARIPRSKEMEELMPAVGHQEDCSMDNEVIVEIGEARFCRMQIFFLGNL
ncbi:hypothetical protein EJB05_57357, partial [Eragrostis curvula]